MKKCSQCTIRAECKLFHLKQTDTLDQAQQHHITSDNCFFTPEQILACDNLGDLSKLKAQAREMQAVQACVASAEAAFTELDKIFGY